jgi:hypothetical protein
VRWPLAVLKDTFLRVPTDLRLERVASYLDGGTTDIFGRDEHGLRRRIRLTQHMFARRWFGPMPGRLYLGWRRVPVRGRAEAACLTLVERLLAEQEAAGPADGEKPWMHENRAYTLRAVVAFVRSEAYGRVGETTEDEDEDSAV